MSNSEHIPTLAVLITFTPPLIALAVLTCAALTRRAEGRIQPVQAASQPRPKRRRLNRHLAWILNLQISPHVVNAAAVLLLFGAYISALILLGAYAR